MMNIEYKSSVNAEELFDEHQLNNNHHHNYRIKQTKQIKTIRTQYNTDG